MPRSSMIRLDDATERYIQRITRAGMSEKTVEFTAYLLDRLSSGIGNPWMHLITNEQMDEFCFGPTGLWLGKRGKAIKPSSFAHYLSTLKRFFAHAKMMGWADEDPAELLQASGTDAPSVKVLLSASELYALLGACQTPVERIACALGMNTAMRANDIRHLTVGDVILTAGMIQTEIRKTQGLDDKPITMDLHGELVVWLDEYAELMGLASRADLPNEWLLVPVCKRYPPKSGRTGFIIHPMQMYTSPWKLVQRPLARIGHTEVGQGFHTLRRSSARAFFEQLRSSGEGRDHALMIVKDFLNHKTTAMTERYLGLNAERAIRDTLLRDKPFISALARDEQRRVEPVGSLQVLGAAHG